MVTVQCACSDATFDVVTSDLTFSEFFLMFDVQTANLMLKQTDFAVTVNFGFI